MKMATSLAGVLASFLLLNAATIAGDSKEDAIKKERKRFEGTWQVESAEVDGHKLSDDDAKAFTVINAVDGKWSIEQNGKVVAKGTSEIDPTQKPKTVDLTQTDGNGAGQKLLGIYEITKDTRKVCFAPADKARPTEFAAPSGSGCALVVLKSVKK